MWLNSASIFKSKFYDYFILCARFLLAFTFFRYGLSKLFAKQFGVNSHTLETPLQDVSLFELSWYLFDHQPFKFSIGISQILCALLLFVNRTTFFGAFFFLPIITTIFIIDISFMPPELKPGFIWRLASYLVLDLLIILHYKQQVIKALYLLWQNINTHFNWSLKYYLLLPLSVLILQILLLIPRLSINLITQPEETLNALDTIPDLVSKLLKIISN